MSIPSLKDLCLSYAFDNLEVKKGDLPEDLWYQLIKPKHKEGPFHAHKTGMVAELGFDDFTNEDNWEKFKRMYFSHSVNYSVEFNGLHEKWGAVQFLLENYPHLEEWVLRQPNVQRLFPPSDFLPHQ